MVTNHTDAKGRPKNQLRSRLLYCGVIVCLLLSASGLLLLKSSEQSYSEAWLYFLRPLTAALAITLAVIVNLWFCAPSQNEQTSSDNIVKKSFKDSLRRFTQHPLLWLWIRHAILIIVTACCAAIALYLTEANLKITPDNRIVLSHVIPAGSALLAVTFALLVCERMLSFRPVRYWQLQNVSVGLLRVLLSIFLLVTVALAMYGYILILSVWMLKIASILVALVAIEICIRTLIALAIIPALNKPSPFLTRSLLADQFHWPFRPLQQMRRKIFQHFGIDVSKVQAFQLIGKIFVPVMTGIIVIGWLVSGLNQVPLDSRGVYERFGHPVAVLKPGLHVGLPWPFGKVVPVDYGAVHELKLSDSEAAKETLPSKIVDPIEGPAPQESWRLWDNSHSTDQAQLIASGIDGKQSFQIVNMDIRLMWRVGMQDTDAMKSLYQTEDIPTLLQRVARQVLAQYFAHQQLDDLLNEQRAAMSVELNRSIQQRLDRLDIGVELLYTRVESIHPPAGVANAYHAVQAAQIAANAGIMREKGYAATVTNDAQRKATVAINQAEASANELHSKANRSQLLYTAEFDAWKINPEAYINERRYQTYSKALSKTPLLIIDSQASGTNEPMLDLRQFSQPSR